MHRDCSCPTGALQSMPNRSAHAMEHPDRAVDLHQLAEGAASSRLPQFDELRCLHSKFPLVMQFTCGIRLAGGCCDMQRQRWKGHEHDLSGAVRHAPERGDWQCTECGGDAQATRLRSEHTAACQNTAHNKWCARFVNQGVHLHPRALFIFLCPNNMRVPTTCLARRRFRW